MQLFIKQQFISLGDKYTVTDGGGNVFFKVKSRIFSPFRHKKYLQNASGETFMILKRKILTILKNVMILDANGQKLAIIKRKFSLRKKFAVNGYGSDIRIDGDLFAWHFSISRDGRPIGWVDKKIIHIRDSYMLNIDNPADAPFFTACVIAIDNLYHNNKKRSLKIGSFGNGR